MVMAEKWSSPVLLKIWGSVVSVASSFGMLFVTAAVCWLLGTRLLKGGFTFIQAVEVCGLAGMIKVLGGIIQMLLIVVMGTTLATPSPALLIRELNPSHLPHLFLSALNVMTLWYIAVLAIGLAKLSGAAVAKTSLYLFTLWALVTSGFVLLGWAAQRVLQ